MLSKKSLQHTATLLLFFVVFGFVLSVANTATAETDPFSGNPVGGGGTKGKVIDAAKKYGQPLLGKAATVGGSLVTFWLIAYLARSVGSVLVFYTASFLDQAFAWNEQGVFTLMAQGPIELFWGYARDIANSFLILMLLWIAFGIIFNLERINAKKLLVRVIMVGLLINFSLTLTYTVFGLANALAKPFATQLRNSTQTGGLSDKIISISNIHTTYNAAGQNKDAVSDLIKQSSQSTSQAPGSDEWTVGLNTESDEGAFIGNTIPQKTANESVASLPGVNEAEAVAPVVVAAAWGIAKLIGAYVAWEAADSFFQSFVFGKFDGPIDGLTQQGVLLFLNPIFATVFLVVAAFVMGSLAIIFVARGIAIMILAILSPLAFLAAVIPGQEKYWQMWLGKLLNWAFFAPIVYFLLLFTFYVGDLLQKNTDPAAKAVELQASLPGAFQFLLIMGLLVSSLVVAKKMGIELAGTMMKMGERWAWKGAGLLGGAALGGLKKATLPNLGQISGGIEEKIGDIKNPYLRQALSIPGAGLRRMTGIGRGVELEAQKKWAGKASPEIQRAISQGLLFGSDLTGAVMELRKRNDLDLLKGTEGASNLRTVVERLQGVNSEDYMDLIKANPTIAKVKDIAPADEKKQKEVLAKMRQLALEKLNLQVTDDQAAQLYFAGKIRPDGWPKVDFSIFDNEEETVLADGTRKTMGDLMKEMYLAVARGEHNSQVGRANPGLVAKFKTYLETDRGKAIISRMDPAVYQYYATNIARELGWILPDDLKFEELPNKIQREEEARRDVESKREAVEGVKRITTNEIREAEKTVSQVERMTEEIRRVLSQRKELDQRIAALQERVNELRRGGDPADGPRVRDVMREINRINDVEKTKLMARIENLMESGDLASEDDMTPLLNKLGAAREDVERKRRESEEKVKMARDEWKESLENLRRRSGRGGIGAGLGLNF